MWAIGASARPRPLPPSHAPLALAAAFAMRHSSRQARGPAYDKERAHAALRRRAAHVAHDGAARPRRRGAQAPAGRHPQAHQQRGRRGRGLRARPADARRAQDRRPLRPEHLPRARRGVRAPAGVAGGGGARHHRASRPERTTSRASSDTPAKKSTRRHALVGSTHVHTSFSVACDSANEEVCSRTR